MTAEPLSSGASSSSPRHASHSPCGIDATTTTHYDALGLSPRASDSEIKAAHRRAALRCHPDRRRGGDGASSGDNGDGADNGSLNLEFLRVQAAWECLRDPQQRRSYDEALRRREDREASKRAAEGGGAVGTVQLSEMQWEACDVVSEDEDGEGMDKNDGRGEVESYAQRVFLHPCRCGEMFEILEEEVVEMAAAVTAEGSSSKGDNDSPRAFLECRSCSLAICVVIDVALAEGV